MVLVGHFVELEQYKHFMQLNKIKIIQIYKLIQNNKLLIALELLDLTDEMVDKLTMFMIILKIMEFQLNKNIHMRLRI